MSLCILSGLIANSVILVRVYGRPLAKKQSLRLPDRQLPKPDPSPRSARHLKKQLCTSSDSMVCLDRYWYDHVPKALSEIFGPDKPGAQTLHLRPRGP